MPEYTRLAVECPPPAIMGGMIGRTQFTTSKALVATAVMAVWCGVAFIATDVAYKLPRPWVDVVGFPMIYFIVALPPAALGILVGRFRFALLCGSISAAALIVWRLFVFVSLDGAY